MGINCSIFAYGQTGSGKSFTMNGSNVGNVSSDDGISSNLPNNGGNGGIGSNVPNNGGNGGIDKSVCQFEEGVISMCLKRLLSSSCDETTTTNATYTTTTTATAKTITASTTADTQIQVSFLEIYNERVINLTKLMSNLIQ